MDRWAPLKPSKPGDRASSIVSSSLFPHAISHQSHPLAAKLPPPQLGAWIGPLPETLHLLVISFLPVYELPKLARLSKAFGRLVSEDQAWKARCLDLGLKDDTTESTKSASHSSQVSSTPTRKSSKEVPLLTSLSKSRPTQQSISFSAGSAKAAVETEDEFGDFVDVPIPADPFGISKETDLMDFDNISAPLPSRASQTGGRTTGFFAFSPAKPNPSSQPSTSSSLPSSSQASERKTPWREIYKTHHTKQLSTLSPLLSSPSSPAPSQILSLLFSSLVDSSSGPSSDVQSKVLLTLLQFLSAQIQPMSRWESIRYLILAAADRFDAVCLAGFEGADEREDEAEMKQWAKAGWEVWWEVNGRGKDSGRGRTIRVEEWELGRVWMERMAIFYEGGGGKWNPSKNIIGPPESSVPRLDFTPMEPFIAHLTSIIVQSGSQATRVFPPPSKVLHTFIDRILGEVVGEQYIQPLLQRARDVGASTGRGLFLRASAGVFAMVEKMVDVILKTGTPEGEDPSSGGLINRKEVLSMIFSMFEFNMDEYLDEEMDYIRESMEVICKDWDGKLKIDSSMVLTSKDSPAPTTFLTSENPAQVKRNVLAGFRDVLLLPVTIIPKTASYVVAGSSAAMSGLSMLNPNKWTGSGAVTPLKGSEKVDHGVVFELGEDEDEHQSEKNAKSTNRLSVPSSISTNNSSLSVNNFPTESSTSSRPTSRSTTPLPPSQTFESLQLLISLDVALELIQTDREALKRVETFQEYPGRMGSRVKETIEEVFILLLQALSDRHIAPGFKIATEQMKTYKPGDHEDNKSVAPLLQFFELVHIGDTVQSMVQVYFDKEMAPHIDRTDFLNGVVREKKRFENVLDEAVASGLNAGIEVLMNQAEHIIISRTGPREYYPEEGAEMDLGPTKGCKEAIASLQMHCDLLKGSTSKDVLEVFFQEVGIRLQNILQKHLKRQIISLNGGFQIIADLNAYHAFVASLKQQWVTEDFSNLKMVGHVFIVEDAKDLAQIVRDVTRYGGSFRPEDVYEFIQRRADWKQIEKTVDNAMYSLSLKEDCVIC
ncbi:Exocyst subunit-Sec10p [Phaffia rhodozyma]|uniref:Exocyst subunit-Sec10p n=1 Tax=Phaffia rhodozyma TaxID=264483 RepID=A0A0F7SEM0_PHARH|nr:Exocyst subunit-Sec10p [Phaffia rhodozyma]